MKNKKNLLKQEFLLQKGASIFERFKSSLLPRNRDARDIESVVSDPVGVEVDTLGYRLPSAENLYPGRPKGEQGPVIRYQRNQDGTIESIFPWNDPGVTAGDWAEYVTRELPSIAGEILVTSRLRAGRKPNLLYYKKPFEKVREFGKYAAATGLGAAFSDWGRLATGAALYDNDSDFDALFKEAALIGAYATGGNAAATTVLNGARATWRFFTGKMPSDAVVARIVDLRNIYQGELKRLGFKEGTPKLVLYLMIL